MPQIKVRGISPEKLCQIGENLIEELAQLIDCPKDHFELEYFQSLAIRGGSIEAAAPFVEIAWFDRGQELQDQAAKIITRYVHDLGFADIELAFTYFKRENYYENGSHF